MPSCLSFACSNKSGKLNETKNFFKVPPDPKNNRDSCSCTTLVMPVNAKCVLIIFMLIVFNKT